jgi:hypothetical protein
VEAARVFLVGGGVVLKPYQIFVEWLGIDLNLISLSHELVQC